MRQLKAVFMVLAVLVFGFILYADDMKSMGDAKDMQMTSSPTAQATKIVKKVKAKKAKAKAAKAVVTEAKLEGNPDDMVQCPVMGKKLKKKDAVAVLAYKGKTYYICCAQCIDKFENDPEKYVK